MRAYDPPARPPKRLTEVFRPGGGGLPSSAAEEFAFRGIPDPFADSTFAPRGAFDGHPHLPASDDFEDVGPSLGSPVPLPALAPSGGGGGAFGGFAGMGSLALSPSAGHGGNSSSLPPAGFFEWGAMPVGSIESELELHRFLQQVKHLTIADLVTEIALEEENYQAQKKARLEMEAALRGELERLQIEIRALRREGAQVRQEAERAMAACETVKHHNNTELKALCRKLGATQRGTQATRRMAQQTMRYQQLATQAREELAVKAKESEEKKKGYESASETLELMAMRVAAMEKEKAEIDEAGVDEDIGHEAKALMTAKTSLVKEMNGIRDIMDLRYLLDLEKANAEGRRIANSRLVEEVAELEREGEVLDRTNQQAVHSLRCLLERGAAREKELDHAKGKACDWLKAVWTAMCKQRKDELALFEKIKQDDVTTEHMQCRIDSLIQELKQLEADARTYGTGPDPLPVEEALEEKLQRGMAGARQQRRGAHHALAVHLTRHRPLVEAVAAAEEEERHLNRQLRSVRQLVRCASPPRVTNINLG